MTDEQLLERYYELVHAVQTGVAMMNQTGIRKETVKHLTVGQRSAWLDAESLHKSLADRGVVSDPDFDNLPPVEMRTGINAALAMTSALADLLIEKNVITRREWLERLVTAFEREVASYEEELSTYMGTDVELA